MSWTEKALSYVKNQSSSPNDYDLRNVIMEAIEEGGDPNYVDSRRYWSLLIYAVVAREEILVRALLSDGADPNLRVIDNFTVLDYAAMNGTTDAILRILVESGADIRTKWRRTRESPLLQLSPDTPLGQLETWKELGADFAPDRIGRTLLHSWAGSVHDVSRLRRLIDMGIPVDIRETYYGYTAFGCALNGNSSVDVMRFLAAHGADINVKDLKGNPVWFSLADDRPQHSESQKKRREKLLVLLELGVDINAADADGRTFLHIACEASTASRSAKYVLQKHPNVKVRDKRGRTILDCLEANKEMPEDVCRELKDIIKGEWDAQPQT